MNAAASPLLKYWLYIQYFRIHPVVNVKCGQRPLFTESCPAENYFFNTNQAVDRVQRYSTDDYRWDLLIVNKRLDTSL